MKTLTRFLIFPLLSAAFLTDCKQNDTCTDPIREYPMPAKAARILLTPMKPGDSLNFKVYRKDKANGGKYIYLRDEGFYIYDTTILKVKEKNTHRDFFCNEWMTSDYLVANVVGPEPLTIKLDNMPITNLTIALQKKNFKTSYVQDKPQPGEWIDNASINGKIYDSIYIIKGRNAYDDYYVDSTYCFRNKQYGILKFIINDTLIYNRIIK